MKILLAIKGCEDDARNGVHDVIRETWFRLLPGSLTHATDVNAEALFFVGRGRFELESDEIRLDCDDDYRSLPNKTREILRWALAQGYDFIYLCDTDTFVMPDRLFNSGFQNYDYMGGFNGDGQLGVPKVVGPSYCWASGGPGYWVSARAARLVVDAPRIGPDGDWAEDRWVGQVLGPELAAGRLKGCHNLRYYWGRNGAHEVIDIMLHYSSHGSNRPFDPAWMRGWFHEVTQLW